MKLKVESNYSVFSWNTYTNLLEPRDLA